MTITPELELELAKFPIAMRSLIEAELAAGNSIIEVGHSFPAPPAGAYVKLEKRVSTRVRADGDGLCFYDRNNSSYSGEFTDLKRFHFVLEPPNQPPAYPDTDAIRKSLESQSSPTEAPFAESICLPTILLEESAAGSTRVLNFRDERPPHEVRIALERTIKSVFKLAMENGKLCMRAKANVVGALYDFYLCFEAALSASNCYSLRADATWGERPVEHAEYFRKTSGSWFAHWTSDFVLTHRTIDCDGSADLYLRLCEEALNAEKFLASVGAIQQAIIAAMKDGGRYSDSHKEGGTNIYWNGKRFVRSDYGDYPSEKHFTDEKDFLKMLYQFCHYDATCHSHQNQVSEIDIWRLIFRKINLG